jgi:hypothetical protein
MTHDNKSVKLGRLGREFYIDIFDEDLLESKLEETEFTTSEGKVIKLMTQPRHPNQCFTANTTSETFAKFTKFLTVDKLVFIEYSLSDMITIYECTERNVFFKTTTRAGDNMACWPIENMKIIYKVKHPALAANLRSLSVSNTLQHQK